MPSEANVFATRKAFSPPTALSASRIGAPDGVSGVLPLDRWLALRDGLEYSDGTPVVASNIAGYRDVVRNRLDGLLVPAGDAADVVHHLRLARSFSNWQQRRWQQRRW